MHELRAIAGSSSQSGVLPPVALPRRAGNRLPWMIAAVSVLAAAGIAFALVSRELAPKRPVQLSLTVPEQARFPPYASAAVISPDGRAVAFSAQDSSGGFSLWRQSLDSPEAIRLARTAGYCVIFWSPDSRTIGILDIGDGNLKTIGIEGGTPVTLHAGANGRGGSWNRRGVILFAPATQGPLLRISASGGEPAQATWLDSTRHEAAHRFPYFLPDGAHFLFAALPPGPEGFDIHAGSLSSRAVRKIMTAGSAVTYAEPGYLLFRRGGKVMSQRFDAGRLKLTGDPVAIADAPPISEMDSDPVANASRDGLMVYLVGQLPETQLEWIDRSGGLRNTLSLPAGGWGRPELSPDDRYAVVPKGDDLWRVDLARSVAVRLTSNGSANFAPVWSPDGARIAFTMGGQRGREEIFIMNSDGSGEAQLLATIGDLFKSPEDWTEAGFVFSGISPATFRDLCQCRCRD